jgi:hypothetical protein
MTFLKEQGKEEKTKFEAQRQQEDNNKLLLRAGKSLRVTRNWCSFARFCQICQDLAKPGKRCFFFRTEAPRFLTTRNTHHSSPPSLNCSQIELDFSVTL